MHVDNVNPSRSASVSKAVQSKVIRVMYSVPYWYLLSTEL